MCVAVGIVEKEGEFEKQRDMLKRKGGGRKRSSVEKWGQRKNFRDVGILGAGNWGLKKEGGAVEKQRGP